MRSPDGKRVLSGQFRSDAGGRPRGGEIVLSTFNAETRAASAGHEVFAAPPGQPTALLALAPGELTDLFDADSLSRLAAAVDIDPARTLLDPAAAPDPGVLARAEVLVTSWGTPRLDAALLAALPRLRLVVHAAGTVKYLVDGGVFARGVRVSSAAEANAVPVAEYTLAAVILATKRSFAAAARYRAGARAANGSHRNLDGLGRIGAYRLTVGVVGASRIGRRVVRLLRDVLDAEVLVYDPFGVGDLTADPRVRRTGLDELLRASDVVSLHAPLTPQSAGMIDARGLALMRDGAILVNTARGGLVVHEALAAELASGRLDAVLDVTDPEPLPRESVLFELPNVFVTPHIAGALGPEVLRLGRLAVEEVERYAAGLPLRYEVSPEQLDRLA